MSKHIYTPDDVCSSGISFEIEDGLIHNLTFTDGCHGNLQALGKLCEGQRVDHVIGLLKGIDCEGRGTSCADQLAKALESVQNAQIIF